MVTFFKETIEENNYKHVDNSTYNKCIFKNSLGGTIKEPTDRIVLNNIIFEKCTFSQIRWSSIKFINCNFIDCLFKGVNNFDTCIFEECYFTGLIKGTLINSCFNDVYYGMKSSRNRAFIEDSVKHYQKIAWGIDISNATFHEVDFCNVLAEKVKLGESKDRFRINRINLEIFLKKYEHQINEEAFEVLNDLFEETAFNFVVLADTKVKSLKETFKETREILFEESVIF